MGAWLTEITHYLRGQRGTRRVAPVDPSMLEDVVGGATPAQHGRAVVLAAMRGMTTCEAAPSEGSSLGTGKPRIRAAARWLASTLEPWQTES